MSRRFMGWKIAPWLSAVLALALMACSDSAGPVTGSSEGELQGVVILDAMAPLPGVTIQLQRPGRTLSTYSDDVGRFAFRALSAGEWNLIVGLPSGYALPAGHSHQRVVQIPEAGLADVNIAVVNGDGFGSFVAQVFADSMFPDGNQFLPVAGVLVQVFNSGETVPVAETRSGDNGLAIIPVPAGEYDIAVVPGNGWEVVPGTEGRLNGLTVASGESRQVEFRIQQTGGGGNPTLGTIAGTALLHDLDPVPGVEAMLARSDFVMVEVTGQGGTFTFTDLQPGDWVLSLIPPQGYVLAADEPNPRTISISETDLYHRVNVSLTTPDGNGSLVVEVGSESPTLQDSLGVRDVTVRVYEGGGNSAIETATTDHGGRATFRLAPGNYDAEIVVPSGYELPSGESPRREGLTITEGHATFALFRLVPS
ncbi:MAG: hypothetical protein GWN99_11340 [Gemmatimonadetes bacterium]|uniref:Carboxypeptidase regulatory-like domain-containing protein n=1 Tax=Candidatus Kutchimonas denitrificans TaxID=3056748 RepID=A0AAE4Z7U7_9BACT|nr:hypothetical protein [Gemmatimonadota bacterium]NIR74077.1 hypothetical protein [Candidatus Kutchimonas denitrificans]NIS01639.1 hypothetical protein [Gemmatimonadota bacterium]NIT67377.1 hypothetical protein [Gemmatimonadota bacterium]NIU52740.1 hypothetical protein [Gemmatimonadota bacterium]